ncbi:DUF58 domain-containing protein [Ilumatobacter nonamiensis]|uniref:DUF58 domain-containing protein n=1 Tax=Ilumatobacter nonamiensis TaxID=467093 RepID=UPI000344BC02|nr:DUF58 domain-containing protein [Ilumatobacter nonamiensis]
MLTRSGLGAVLGSIILVALGLWWGYEELLVAAAGTGAVVILAVLSARRRLRARVERRIQTIRVPRGDPVRVKYRIRNDTGHRSGRATVLDRIDRATIEVQVDPVDGGDVHVIDATMPTRRRGVFEVGPLDVQKIDPFFLAIGKWRSEQDAEHAQKVTVHPKIYDLVGPQGSSRVIENESIVRRAAADPLSGFVSMREYVAGDDPRMIHWPTTARTGTLMVREHIEVRRPEFTIVVDTGTAVGTPDDFEEIVDVAATLAVHALRTGLDVVVRTTDPANAGRETPIVTEAEVLDLLTPVFHVGSGALHVAALFGKGFDHTSVVMVTGPDGPTTRLSAHDRMTTVRVGVGAKAGVGISVAAQDAPDFVQQWHSWTGAMV